jgi:large subunit ribosomal protein L15
VATRKEDGVEQLHNRISLDNLTASPGSHRARKRLGRGPGSGTGKTSGKGHKGIKARSGHHGPGGGKPQFEGGQMPLTRRIPKRGFHNPNNIRSQVVRLDAIEKIAEMTTVTEAGLTEAGLIQKNKGKAKLLANGAISRAVTVQGVAMSGAAREAILAAGGRVEE